MTTFPNVTATADGNASAAFVTAAQQSGISVGGLAAISQLQLVAANLLNQGVLSSGTFTPGLTFGGGSTGMSFSLQQGTYLKVANLVFYRARVDLTAKGSSTGSAVVTGLPFTVGGVSYPASPLVFTLASITGQILPFAAAGSTIVSLTQVASSTAADLTDANFANTSVVIVSGFYSV